jgi:hypothetical protein
MVPCTTETIAVYLISKLLCLCLGEELGFVGQDGRGFSEDSGIKLETWEIKNIIIWFVHVIVTTVDGITSHSSPLLSDEYLKKLESLEHLLVYVDFDFLSCQVTTQSNDE